MLTSCSVSYCFKCCPHPTTPQSQYSFSSRGIYLNSFVPWATSFLHTEAQQQHLWLHVMLIFSCDSKMIINSNYIYTPYNCIYIMYVDITNNFLGVVNLDDKFWGLYSSSNKIPVPKHICSSTNSSAFIFHVQLIQKVSKFFLTSCLK